MQSTRIHTHALAHTHAHTRLRGGLLGLDSLFCFSREALLITRVKPPRNESLIHCLFFPSAFSPLGASRDSPVPCLSEPISLTLKLTSAEAQQLKRLNGVVAGEDFYALILSRPSHGPGLLMRQVLWIKNIYISHFSVMVLRNYLLYLFLYVFTCYETCLCWSLEMM